MKKNKQTKKHPPTHTWNTIYIKLAKKRTELGIVTDNILHLSERLMPANIVFCCCKIQDCILEKTETCALVGILMLLQIFLNAKKISPFETETSNSNVKFLLFKKIFQSEHRVQQYHEKLDHMV